MTLSRSNPRAKSRWLFLVAAVALLSAALASMALAVHNLELNLVTVSVRIRPDISVERLAQISSVESALAARQARPRELDFRFRDQVIARFP